MEEGKRKTDENTIELVIEYRRKYITLFHHSSSNANIQTEEQKKEHNTQH